MEIAYKQRFKARWGNAKKEVSIDGTKYKVIINDSQPVNTYTSISGVGKAEISNLNHAEKNF